MLNAVKKEQLGNMDTGREEGAALNLLLERGDRWPKRRGKRRREWIDNITTLKVEWNTLTGMPERGMKWFSKGHGNASTIQQPATLNVAFHVALTGFLLQAQGEFIFK